MVEKSKIYNSLKRWLILLVVIAHITRMYTGYGAFTPVWGSAILKMVTEYIYQFHMPMFISISGMVYGICMDNNKYKSIRVFLVKKIKRLLVPYFVWGAVWVAPTMLICELTELNYLQYLFGGIILSNDSRHLWYLLALFWIFLISILCRHFFAKCLIGVLVMAIGLHAGFWMFPSILQIANAAYYFIFFVLGYIINKHFEKICMVCSRLWRVWIFMPIVLAGCLVWKPNRIINFCYILIGIFMLLFAAIETEKVKSFKRGKLNKYNELIDRNSFGIYLIHPMLIYILFFVLGETKVNPYFYTVLVFVVTLIASIALTEIIRKTNALRFMIGEEYSDRR